MLKKLHEIISRQENYANAQRTALETKGFQLADEVQMNLIAQNQKLLTAAGF